jgi:hypothetical protein
MAVGVGVGVGDGPAGTGVGAAAVGVSDSVGVGAAGDSAGPLGVHSGHGHPTTTGTIRRYMLQMSPRLTSSIHIQDKKTPIGL